MVRPGMNATDSASYERQQWPRRKDQAEPHNKGPSGANSAAWERCQETSFRLAFVVP